MMKAYGLGSHLNKWVIGLSLYAASAEAQDLSGPHKQDPGPGAYGHAGMSASVMIADAMAGPVSPEAPQRYLGNPDLIIERWRAQADRWLDYDCRVHLTIHGTADRSRRALPPEQWRVRTEEVRYIEDLVNGYYYIERRPEGSATENDALNDRGEYQSLRKQGGRRYRRITRQSLLRYEYFPVNLAFRDDGPGPWPMLPSPSMMTVTLTEADEEFTGAGAFAACVRVRHGWQCPTDRTSMSRVCWEALVDVRNGCLPRRIHFFNNHGKIERTIRDIQYTQLPQGAFPTSATVEHYDLHYAGEADKGGLWKVVEVLVDPTTLAVNQEPDPSVFSVDRPAVTTVADRYIDDPYRHLRTASGQPLPDLLDHQDSQMDESRPGKPAQE